MREFDIARMRSDDLWYIVFHWGRQAQFEAAWLVDLMHRSVSEEHQWLKLHRESAWRGTKICIHYLAENLNLAINELIAASPEIAFNSEYME